MRGSPMFLDFYPSVTVVFRIDAPDNSLLALAVTSIRSVEMR